MHPRMQRERKTIQAMIGLFCQHHHGERKETLCNECQELQEYALLRLRHCPFQEGKTSCGNCLRHCYKPDMRDRVRNLMRFSGPKMLWVHPILAIFHLFDGLRKSPKGRKKYNVDSK
ncbi:MAG: nitrous oxide-stimulated promoter family protein [Desulfobulbaceae bacterium]|nr:nitrous oxide-stimulated promoter family protein [Desulfobulbaceae bacterium]